MALNRGSAAGPYRVMEPLGRGGMASVYRAYEPGLDRQVALKVLPREFLHDPTFAKRFRQEAQVIARLEHPNIVPIYAYDIDRAEGIPWMAMRLIAGGSLSQLLKRERPSFARAVAILRGVADALDYAHAKGIVHRDVKPHNVLLDDAGRVYLADFGIAKILESSVGLTATGMSTGTPQYMAPEQATGTKVGPAADVYALGIVAYEMFTGHVPFSADTPVAIMMKHVQEPLPLPPPDTVPESLLGPLLRCTAKKPEERWASAGAFVTALEEGLEGRTARPGEVPTIVTPPPPRAATPPVRPRPTPPTSILQPLVSAPTPDVRRPARRGLFRPAVVLGLGVAALVAALGLGIVALTLLRGGGPPVPSPTPATTLRPPSTAEPSPSPTGRPRTASTPGPVSTGLTDARATKHPPVVAGREPTPMPTMRATPTSPPMPTPTPRATEPAPPPRIEPTVPPVDPEVQRLVAAVGQGETGSRWRAAQALGAMGPAAGRAVPSLVGALGDRSSEVRWRAAEALGLIGPAALTAVPALARALGDADPLVCAEAAKALGLLGAGAASAVPQLGAVLTARDTACRREAAKALARMGRAAEPALGSLIGALKDKDKFVRAQAARALGLIGPPAREAVPALTALSRDSELVVSREAQAALKSIAGN